MNDIIKAMTFLKEEIRKKVFQGVAEAYNKEVVNHFATHPYGIGVTLQHFKQLKVAGNLSKETIAFFDNGYGYPAILQQGTTPRSGYTYPYDSVNGTKVWFDEEPTLLQWAKENYKGFTPTMTGLVIGKSGTTGFGKPYNRWVTKSGEAMKSNSNARNEILSGLRKIKIK